MKTSPVGVALIKEFEGFRPTAYKCPAGVWTLGYGQTEGVNEGSTCTYEEAEKTLLASIAWREASVNKHVKVPLKQNQFDALVSFVYNVGAGAFSNSTLLFKLNNGDFAGAAAEFDKWAKAKHKVLPGLVARRTAERKMFEGG